MNRNLWRNVAINPCVVWEQTIMFKQSMDLIKDAIRKQREFVIIAFPTPYEDINNRKYCDDVDKVIKRLLYCFEIARIDDFRYEVKLI